MTAKEQPRIAVLLPCYNEAAAIAQTIADFRAALPEATIYVYDNNSHDATAEIARASGAVVRTERMQGKGHVVRRMFADIDADIYVMADGDATYEAAAAPKLIALLQDGWPVLGIIDQPITRERWVGAIGQPTQFNGRPATTRRCRTLDDVILATTSPHLFTEHQADHFLGLAGKVARRRIIYGGDCYNYGLVASGHVDLVVEAGLKLYDFAALVPIVEGAGGNMCDWHGHPLNADSSGEVIALGDPARLEDVLEALAHQHCA